MVIAFANHKGGTGKTTSTINIGRALANCGKKVLLIDLDPQGNMTYSLGLSEQKYVVSDYLLGHHSLEEVACEAFNMHILPSDGSLYDSIKEMENSSESIFLLKRRLLQISSNYDYILLDCPPSISIYTLNALNAADRVIIPLVFEILSIQGLDQILIEIEKIRKSSNPGIQVMGALGVIVNENRKLTEEVLMYIRDNYRINIFNNHIRNNVKAAEAPSFGESVIDYAPNSISAKDYINVTNELLRMISLESEPVHLINS